MRPSPARLAWPLALVGLLGAGCSSTATGDAAAGTLGTSTTVAVTTTTSGNSLIDLGGPVAAGDLPVDFPTILVDDGTGDIQPGWTLFNLRRFGGPSGDTISYVVMTDDAGEVRWLVQEPGAIGQTLLTSAGTVLYILDDATIREVDLEGRLVREYVSDATASVLDGPHPVIRVDVETFHHEITELPDGNLLVLASETRVVETDELRCDDAERFDGSYKVVGDEVVEIERSTGEVLSRRSLFTVFDPLETPGSDFCTFGAPFGPFPDDPNANDWSHANAASLGPDGEIIVSIRHLDTVLAWPGDDPEAAPLWIFGPGGSVSAAPGEDFLHQHAPEMLTDGTLLVYDNGNDRPGPDGEPIEPLFSRVVGYELDGGEAELVWEYRRESRGEPVYAMAVGDVDRLPNGNTLVVDGFIALDRAEIAEVGPDGDLVRLITIDAEDAAWLVYRAERVPEPVG